MSWQGFLPKASKKKHKLDSADRKPQDNTELKCYIPHLISQVSRRCQRLTSWNERLMDPLPWWSSSIYSFGADRFAPLPCNSVLGLHGPVVSTLRFNHSAESRGAGSVPGICPGRCMSLSCAVNFSCSYSVWYCNL